MAVPVGTKLSRPTFLTFVNSLASATVHIAQRADVYIGFDASTQLAVFYPVAFHNANTEFVMANGADALMHQVQMKCQEYIVSGTKYQSDPEYNMALQMNDAHMDATGSGHIKCFYKGMKNSFLGMKKVFIP